MTANTCPTGSLKALFEGYEAMHILDDPKLGFIAIIAIHDTTLGPSLGGCRRMSYPTLWDAFVDVARLAEGMSYKAALAGLPLGGGKCVMIPRKKSKRLRSAQYRALGEFIESLGGTHISAEDVGTFVPDILEMAKKTKYVCGKMNGHPYHGDPSYYTAIGVYYGMLGTIRAVEGNSATLAGRSVYVEGIGKVGFPLMQELHKAGARLLVSNRLVTESERTALKRAHEEFGAEIVPLEEDGAPKHFPYAEIYAPCALGGTVSSEHIYNYPFGLKYIAGSANNILLDPVIDGDYLRRRNIVCAPDYVINNRGLWDVHHQRQHEAGIAPYNEETVLLGCRDNERLLGEIISRALHEEECPHVIADKMAKEVINRKKYEHESV